MMAFMRDAASTYSTSQVNCERERNVKIDRGGGDHLAGRLVTDSRIK